MNHANLCLDWRKGSTDVMPAFNGVITEQSDSHTTALRLCLVRLLLFILLNCLYQQVAAALTESAEIAIGRRIYYEGISSTGEKIQATRLHSITMDGQSVACVQCHRKSGMGSLEGNSVIPPISGRFLFQAEENPLVLLDPRAPKNVSQIHHSYSEASFAKALREGVKHNGEQLLPLMPLYQLNDADVHALVLFLKQLSSAVSPGVAEDSVRFATIITPDVDPQRREVLVRMLQSAFMQRNVSQESASGQMRMPIDLLPRTYRRWELVAWELHGSAETWSEQLAEKYRQTPVFAVISGVSNNDWQPMQQFCQHQQVPCLFPSATLVPDETAFYALYLSQGVRLEARVLARQLMSARKTQRVVQIISPASSSVAAAKALQAAVSSAGIKLEQYVFEDKAKPWLRNILQSLHPQDKLVLWLSPAELAALAPQLPAKLPVTTYLSEYLLRGDYHSLPSAWHPNIRVLYPYTLSDQPAKHVAQLPAWLKTWQLPLVDEKMQAEVFFNLLLLTDLTSQLLDNWYRDYFVERAEDMLGWGTNVTYYPNLSLAPGQRFASKGGYVARFVKGKLVADSEWLVP